MNTENHMTIDSAADDIAYASWEAADKRASARVTDAMVDDAIVKNILARDWDGKFELAQLLPFSEFEAFGNDMASLLDAAITGADLGMFTRHRIKRLLLKAAKTSIHGPSIADEIREGLIAEAVREDQGHE